MWGLNLDADSRICSESLPVVIQDMAWRQIGAMPFLVPVLKKNKLITFQSVEIIRLGFLGKKSIGLNENKIYKLITYYIYIFI